MDKAEHEKEKLVRARYEKPKLNEHEGKRTELDDARRAYESVIRDLFENRRTGIDEAARRIEDFRREDPPAVKPSLVASLAWSALNMVTYGMASNIAGVVKLALEKPGFETTPLMPFDKGPVHGPRYEKPTTVSPAITTLVTEMVKKGLRGSAEAAIKEMRGTAGTKDTKGHSAADDQDAAAMFISAQTKAFLGDFNHQAEQSSKELFNALMVTTMKTDPNAAIRVMEAATRAVKAEAMRATGMQLQATFQHWASYVAQSSLGSVERPGLAPVIDMTDANVTAGEHAANRPAGEDRAFPNFDGIVDIAFEVANPARPQDPVRFISAKIRGVRNAVADTLVSNGRLKPGVAMRAYAAGAPLTIVRDEAGQISFTDHMGLTGERDSWLSRKAGHVRPSVEAQRKGARMLLDELHSSELPEVTRTPEKGSPYTIRGLQTDSKS
jgi:hypothetical protein